MFSRRFVLPLVSLFLFSVLGALASPRPSWAAGESISINPTSGVPLSRVLVNGTSWHRGVAVPIKIGTRNLAFGHPNIWGKFNVSIPIPGDTPHGWVRIDAIIGNRLAAIAYFNVTNPCSAAGTSITPNSGRRGSKFTIKGTQWHPSDRVKIELLYGSPGRFSPRIQPLVDSSGGWQVTQTVEPPTPNGRYTFILTEYAFRCPGHKIIRHEYYTVTGR